jgi:hypothetical protein
MPSWQITIVTSALLFVAGALVIVTSERKESLVEGYVAWLMSLVVLAFQYADNPKLFASVTAFFAGIPGALADPPIAIAAFCWVILVANVVVALLDKNARLSAKPAELAEIRLGPSEPSVRRSLLRRLADVLMFRSRNRTEAVKRPAAEIGSSSNAGSAWFAMLKSERIREALGISDDEVQMLTQVEFMGEVSSPHDLKLVLAALRSARAKILKEAASDAQMEESRSAPEDLAAPTFKPAG